MTHARTLLHACFFLVIAAVALPLQAEPIGAGGLALTKDITKPVILVATRALVDRLYGRAVLVAVPLKDTHIGFIVNRPSSITMGMLFPEHEPSKKIAETVRFGGPEMAEAIFMVVKSDERPSRRAFPLADGLFAVSSGDEVDAFIERADEKELGGARFFAGFVGWQPGELQREIKRGAWYVLDAPAAEFFFHGKPEELWEPLVEEAARQAEIRDKGI